MYSFLSVIGKIFDSKTDPQNIALEESILFFDLFDGSRLYFSHKKNISLVARIKLFPKRKF